MTLEYTLSEEDYLLYQLYTSSRSQRTQIIKTLSRWVIVVIAFLIVVLDMLLGDYLTATLTALFAIGWGIGYPKMVSLLQVWNFRSHVRDYFKANFGKTMVAEFRDDCLIHRGVGSESKVMLSEIEEMSEIPQIILVKFRSGSSLILPKTQIKDLEQVRSYLQGLAELWGFHTDVRRNGDGGKYAFVGGIALRQPSFATKTVLPTQDFPAIGLHATIFGFQPKMRMMIDRDIERELLPVLAPGEELIWTGRPKTGLKLRTSDAFMIPFSLLWGGFAIFWEVMATTMGAPFFFSLFGIPFVLIGLYMIFGRFFADAKQRANTRYALTRDRIIIRRGLWTTTLNSIQIATLGDITMQQKADGSGTIVLRGDVSSPGSLNYSYGFNSGRGPARYTTQGPRLEMIDNVMSVYNQILELQSGKK